MSTDTEDYADEQSWDSLRTITTFDGLNKSSSNRKYTVANVSRKFSELKSHSFQKARTDKTDGNNSSSFSSSNSNNNGDNNRTASTQPLRSGGGGGGIAPVINQSNTFIDRITNNATTPVSLLVESLVQQLCSMIDSDPTRSSALYHSICEQLHHMNLIDRTYAMGEFELMRSQYQRALYQLVSVARGQDLPVAVQSVWPLTQPVGMDWSRYHREFDEIAYIAGGGFGKVFRARHKLDGIVYAVKKVTIKSITIGRVLSHLAEVKTLAGLNHTNIVPYKAAWLEPLLSEPTTKNRLEGGEGDDDDDADDDDDEEEGEEDSSMCSSYGRQRQHYEEEESSEFIQFERSSESADAAAASSAVICKYSEKIKTHSSSLLVATAAEQPHVNLKWATLFIQMSLCQLTLREWLDQRNQHEHDFDHFYRQFCQKMSPTAPVEPTFLSTHHRRRDDDDDDVVVVVDERPMVTMESVSLEIFDQLVNGLSYIHARGIIHHDIKPSNVFVGVEVAAVNEAVAPQLTVQLGDFGLACPLQDNHAANVIGTPTYAAPEQLNGKCDPKVWFLFDSYYSVKF